jgi:HSP20 family protein
MANWFLTGHGAHWTSIEALHPEGAWQPAVDVYRYGQGWLLKFELAGVRKEDLQVRVDARGITLVGTRRDYCPYELQEAHLMEISYSRFERFVPLPNLVDDLELRVEFHDGMLFVHVQSSDE